jgi:hypothetical protein
MYATLDTGAVNRSLKTADLNVPDVDNGACGLHAGTMLVGSPAPIQGQDGLEIRPTVSAQLGNRASDAELFFAQFKSPAFTNVAGALVAMGIPSPVVGDSTKGFEWVSLDKPLSLSELPALKERTILAPSLVTKDDDPPLESPLFPESRDQDEGGPSMPTEPAEGAGDCLAVANWD